MEAEMEEIKAFLSQDNVDLVKFMANYEIMKNGSVEVYRASIRLHSEEDLSGHMTPSIEKVASPIDRPLGYPNWFVAAYPDIVLWASELEDDELLSILGDVSEENAFDKDHRFKRECLRKVVDAYINKGKRLEAI
jgi:hypothetical protein